ncbi:MAG TPA: hypothetical protein VG779_08510 [Actinomycetota bacterium]|nr:hypothetical protein [Actinomycetota bacterium]
MGPRPANQPVVVQLVRGDRVISAANARHISVLPIVQYSPGWARPSNCTGSDHCAPASTSQYAVFAAAAATRYSPLGVHAWELWNEPNLGGAWMPAANAGQYAGLVAAASRAIKGADAAAVVLSGGLAPAATGGGDLGQLAFLQAFAQAGGLAMVDAVGYHPYSSPVLPSYPDPGNAWQQISTTTTSFRSILASYGYPNMKVWATEYGAPTNGPGAVSDVGNYHLSSHPDHVTEALQAQMATESVSLARQDPIMAALFWYTQIDAGTDASNRENFFGLRRYDFSAKPAFGAYQTAIAPTPSPSPSPTPSPSPSPPPVTPGISAVGNLASSGAPGGLKLSVSPAGAADVWLLAIHMEATTASISSVSGGGATWRRIVGPSADHLTSPQGDDEIWAGTITATGPSTISVSGTSSLASVNTFLEAQEFSSGPGWVWAMDGASWGARDNPASTTVLYPTLTPSVGSTDLYFGFAWVFNAGSAGTTPGFTYRLDAGANVVAFNGSVAGTVSPTAAQSPAAPSVATGVLMKASLPA